MCVEAFVHFSDDFETCSWTITGDWQCGAATSAPGCLEGSGCLSTGFYTNNANWGAHSAVSPLIDLTVATAPVLWFLAYLHTDGTGDGFNVKVSTDGTNYSLLTGVSPAYTGTLKNESAWAGPLYGEGWREYRVDLSAYAGQSIRLRFDFASDGIYNAPGIFIDRVVVADSDVTVPLRIAEKGTLRAFKGLPFTTTLERWGAPRRPSGASCTGRTPAG